MNLNLDPRAPGFVGRVISAIVNSVRALPSNVRSLVVAFGAIASAAVLCAIVDAIAEGVQTVLCVSAVILLVVVVFTLWQNGRRPASGETTITTQPPVSGSNNVKR